MAHTVLFRGEVVYLIALGVSAGGDGCGGQNEEKFFHNELVWFILGMPPGMQNRGKSRKTIPSAQIFWSKIPENCTKWYRIGRIGGFRSEVSPGMDTDL